MLMYLTWAELVFDTIPPAREWIFSLLEIDSFKSYYIAIPMIQSYLVNISDLIKLNVG